MDGRPWIGGMPQNPMEGLERVPFTHNPEVIGSNPTPASTKNGHGLLAGRTCFIPIGNGFGNVFTALMPSHQHSFLPGRPMRIAESGALHRAVSDPGLSRRGGSEATSAGL